MNVVVLGANGFVGRHLCARLTKDGHDVTTFGRNQIMPSAQTDVYINCAGQLDDPLNMVRDNVEIVLYGLNILRRYNPTARFIQVGSSSEYGKVEGPRKETGPCVPYDLYSATKLAATHLCLGYSHQYDLDVCVVRPFSLYGPNDKPRKMVPTLLRCARAGVEFQCYAGGHDWLFIDDFIEGLITLMGAPKSVTKGQVFNLGTGICTGNHQLARTFSSVLPTKVVYIKKEYHPYDVSNWVADISKARIQLGWQPKVSLEEGLRKVVEA